MKMGRITLLAFCAVLGATIAILILLLWRRSVTPRSDEERFRDAVLARLRAEFPAQTFFVVPDDLTSIVAGDFRLNLNNVRRRYELSNKSDQALSEILKEYQVFWSTKEIARRFPRSYEEARHRLLPQFMPLAVVADANQVRMPLAGSVLLGLVVDDDRTYSYVTREALKSWGQTEETAYADALNNLNTRSHGMQFRELQKLGTSFLIVGTQDGFDAARIVVPKIKTAFGGKLGYPFCFGIPNRDFLICWPATTGSEVLKFARERLRQDFQQQPHPISPSIYQVAADGTITVLQEADASSTSRPPGPSTEKGHR
jgi:hypothetical protein